MDVFDETHGPKVGESTIPFTKGPGRAEGSFEYDVLPHLKPAQKVSATIRYWRHAFEDRFRR